MINTTKNAIIGSFLLFALILLGSSVQSFANVRKNVSLPGGVNARTEVTALIHRSLPVTAIFRVRRRGSDNDYGQRLVRFRLISPNGVARTLNRSIGRGYETISLSQPGFRGSSIAIQTMRVPEIRQWKVELQNLERGSNAEVGQIVEGTVTFVSRGSRVITIKSPPRFGLSQSAMVTKNIYMPFTGNLVIRANWDTDEMTLENYRLRFELYKGNRRLASGSGYSRDSVIIGISNSQRFRIRYRVGADEFRIPGRWRIKIYGSSRGKVKNISLKMAISEEIY